MVKKLLYCRKRTILFCICLYGVLAFRALFYDIVVAHLTTKPTTNDKYKPWQPPSLYDLERSSGDIDLNDEKYMVKREKDKHILVNKNSKKNKKRKKINGTLTEKKIQQSISRNFTRSNARFKHFWERINQKQRKYDKNELDKPTIRTTTKNTYSKPLGRGGVADDSFFKDIPDINDEFKTPKVEEVEFETNEDPDSQNGEDKTEDETYHSSTTLYPPDISDELTDNEHGLVKQENDGIGREDGKKGLNIKVMTTIALNEISNEKEQSDLKSRKKIDELDSDERNDEVADKYDEAENNDIKENPFLATITSPVNEDPTKDEDNLDQSNHLQESYNSRDKNEIENDKNDDGNLGQSATTSVSPHNLQESNNSHDKNKIENDKDDESESDTNISFIATTTNTSTIWKSKLLKVLPTTTATTTTPQRTLKNRLPSTLAFQKTTTFSTIASLQKLKTKTSPSNTIASSSTRISTTIRKIPNKTKPTKAKTDPTPSKKHLTPFPDELETSKKLEKIDSGMDNSPVMCPAFFTDWLTSENEQRVQNNQELSYFKKAACNENEVERCQLKDLQGPLIVDRKIMNMDWLYRKELSFVQKGGWYMPTDCKTNYHTAILIPFRKREQHLPVLLRQLHSILRKQQIHYRIFVIEQSDTSSFNRAKLFNVGYKEALHYFPFNCYVFQDVDLVPESDHIHYNCRRSPSHMSVAIDTMNYILPYKGIFGGVSSMTREHFEHLNGYSNLFWTWGGEDDNMSHRIREAGLTIHRQSSNTARYTMLSHKESVKESVEDRVALLEKTYTVLESDGLNSLRYKTLRRTDAQLFTRIQVDLLKDQDKDLV